MEDTTTTNKNGDGVNAVWKWLAAVVVTIMITGSPGLLYALRTWNVSDELRVVRDRQDDVRIRLTLVEAKNQQLEEKATALELRVHELETIINRRP